MTTPALEALLAVQDVDTDLDRHRHRQATLPEREEAAAVRRRMAALDTDIAAAASVVLEMTGRQETLEADLAATEQRMAGVNRRLYSGEVSASRELEAMAADVKTLEARRSDLEDRILAVLDEREPLDERLGVLSAQRSEAASRAEALAGTIGGLDAEIGAEIAALEHRRVGLAAAVAPDLLVTYERLRDRLGGVGAARLVGSRCDGCHLILPAADLDHIRHLPEDAVVFCEECGRILVRP